MRRDAATTAKWAGDMWTAVEPLHAVTYFAEGCRAANRELGLRGFWMGYFASRAAPLGRVPAAVVVATFFNFHPAMVERALPDAWTYADPATILTARRKAAAVVLRGAWPSIDQTARELIEPLERIVEAADPAGRALFAANRAAALSTDPVERLWELATAMREHRGDGHVCVLVEAGVDGCEAHVLAAAAKNIPPTLLRQSRGWSQDQWDAAVERLATRGWLDERADLTNQGAANVAAIESRTDELAARPYDVLDSTEQDALLRRTRQASAAVADAKLIPYPNPIGLPAPR